MTEGNQWTVSSTRKLLILYIISNAISTTHNMQLRSLIENLKWYYYASLHNTVNIVTWWKNIIFIITCGKTPSQQTSRLMGEQPVVRLAFYMQHLDMKISASSDRRHSNSSSSNNTLDDLRYITLKKRMQVVFLKHLRHL